jgi:type IV/VI secretion system ImpK/VasF family protein
MRNELWRAILTTQGDLDKLVAAGVGDYPNQAPPRATTARPAPPRAASRPQLVRAASVATAAGAQLSTPRAMTAQDTARLWADPVRPATAPVVGVEHETLQRLHQDVHARIEVLRAALAAEPGGEQAMLALVLYFDEHIMGQLPEFLATSWPLLQTRLTGRKTGGSDFFRLIDRLLETESPPELVFEVYYFCLASGFQGQYADDLASLAVYQQRLRSRIAAPEPQRQPRELATAASPAPIKSPALYYVVAVAVVMVVGIALTVWSNR